MSRVTSTPRAKSEGGILPLSWPGSKLRGRNRIAESFYNGPGWARFRRWERLFLKIQGGEARARRQILRHLPTQPMATVLEVGIGDGANLKLLPKDWTTYGVDIAVRPLGECLNLHPLMNGRVLRSEGESLPFADAAFDACYSIGGFNYFCDHASTLREMRRVTRVGGRLIVADEDSRLHRWGIGHLIGLKSIDAFWLGALGLDREFVQMVFDQPFDPGPVVSQHWPGSVRHSIWGGLGYCYVASHESEPSTS